MKRVSRRTCQKQQGPEAEHGGRRKNSALLAKLGDSRRVPGRVHSPVPARFHSLSHSDQDEAVEALKVLALAERMFRQSSP